MKCGSFVCEKPRQASMRGLARGLQASCYPLTAETNLKPQKGDWLGSVWSPGDWAADAMSAGCRPRPLMAAGRGEKQCTVYLSSFHQDWFRNWTRLESAGGRNCKAQPLQGLRESSRRARLTQKAKVKKLDPGACPRQNTWPTIQLLSMSWCHIPGSTGQVSGASEYLPTRT